jgi:hypothetical protein
MGEWLALGLGDEDGRTDDGLDLDVIADAALKGHAA